MSESDQSSCFRMPRMVAKNVYGKLSKEGGADIRRPIEREDLKSLDPFVSLLEFSVSLPAGFSNHPHRGFESVTYMLKGGIAHQDLAGHKGTISAGDAQWMTAGRGAVHSEMPAEDGVNQGLQIWISLPSADKMMNPRYQEIPSKDVKRAKRDGVEVRVLAGESMGVRSPFYTKTPTMFLDFNLEPGAQMHQKIAETWNAFAYTIEGEGVFGSVNSSAVSAHNLLVLSPGDGISVWNKSSKPLRFLLVAGQPLNEPVVVHGPFVMNTQAEIDQTIEDYRSCKNGFENAKNLRCYSLSSLNFEKKNHKRITKSNYLKKN